MRLLKRLGQPLMGHTTPNCWIRPSPWTLHLCDPRLAKVDVAAELVAAGEVAAEVEVLTQRTKKNEMHY